MSDINVSSSSAAATAAPYSAPLPGQYSGPSAVHHAAAAGHTSGEPDVGMAASLAAASSAAGHFASAAHGGGASIEEHSAVSQAAVERLIDAGIRCVCWDFDLTVLSIHSYAERISMVSVLRNTRAWQRDFKDLHFFTALVRRLVANDIQVAIASFGKYEVIKAYLDMAFREGYAHFNPAVDDNIDYDNEGTFTRGNIITPSSVGGVDGCSLKEGKNKQLAHLCAVMGLKPNQVMFFDDDGANIALAREAGYAYSLHTPTAFYPPAWEAGLSLLPPPELAHSTGTGITVSASAGSAIAPVSTSGAVAAATGGAGTHAPVSSSHSDHASVGVAGSGASMEGVDSNVASAVPAEDPAPHDHVKPL